MTSRTTIATLAACALAAIAPAAQANASSKSSVSYYQSGATKTILAAMGKAEEAGARKHAVKTSTKGARPDNRAGLRGS